MSNHQDIPTLLEAFRTAALAAANLSNAAAQNKASRRVQEIYKELRTTEEGRKAIISLIVDPSPEVRLPAAARCLQWVPAKARSVLEALRDDEIFPYSFDAEMALEEFEKGNLSFEY
jgi:hypothetical protein